MAEPPAVVYRWDASAWLEKYNHAQFIAAPITNPDGTIGARIAVTPHSEQNPYNHIVVTGAGLKGGNQYTAVLTFSVETPTTYPLSFYLFARNSAGNQYDIWQTWIGLPGATRTIAVPLDLKDIASGTWRLHVGISKRGALNIESLVVYAGLTSDGKSSYVSALPPPPAPSVSPGGASGFTPFTLAPPALTGKVITVAPPAYAFVADAPGADPSVAVTNAAALQKAAKDCRAQAGTKLLIPTGIYRLSSVASISFDSLNDVVVDGQGSTFIVERLSKDGPAFQLSRCNRVEMRNFAIDWDWATTPIASLGVVSNLSADKLQCDFTFPDLDAAATKLAMATPWRSIMPMDPVHLMRNDPNIIHMAKAAVVTPGSADNVLHAVFPSPAALTEGATYCIRHLYYEMAGFKVSDCHDLMFNSVDIFSIPGMGWFFAGDMHRFTLLKCRIARKPGSRTPLTTAADGIHVDQSVGDFLVENCSITGTGDDAMNIHDEAYQGEMVLDPADPTKLTLLHCPSYQLRLKEGDPVDFFNADFSQLGGGTAPVSRQVAKVSSDNKAVDQPTVVQFTAPLPEGLTPLSIVRNGRFGTRNVGISGCTIEYSNGRGILLSAQGATISDCRFLSVYSTPIDLESEIIQPLWTEGRGASNIRIEGNVFENSNQQERYGGATIYSNTRIPWGPTTATLYDGITIERNRFVNSPGPVVSLCNVSNLIVRANQVEVADPFPNPMRRTGAILLNRASSVLLGGNKWADALGALSGGGLVYDPGTVSQLDPGTDSGAR
ncbi:Right handed beta helix region [Verrucomicrobium sp. GAS474]|uniref:right-handed parallel beta-helix repeat-containing protein n=1 Tax=Verrucomicrobium sp. GAS474 TaxID=1882831 RepID=UPI00087B7247|nr:right-handed parallel beta-helix repeat-containing protein [Verrucomicrobium sp. GAS474]SDU29492.1 Right handed beta helix region [Verrucomicrobium sp. GAS474]